MPQKVHVNGFRWVEETSQFNEESDERYLLKFDT